MLPGFFILIFTFHLRRALLFQKRRLFFFEAAIHNAHGVFPAPKPLNNVEVTDEHAPFKAIPRFCLFSFDVAQQLLIAVSAVLRGKPRLGGFALRLV